MVIDYRKKEVRVIVDRNGNAMTPKPGSVESKFILDKGFKLVYYDLDKTKIKDINKLTFR